MRYIFTDPNYLQHFGILGMKWGIRRYQNKDGTLTSAGKKRYNDVPKKQDTRKEHIKPNATKEYAGFKSNNDGTKFEKNVKINGNDVRAWVNTEKYVPDPTRPGKQVPRAYSDEEAAQAIDKANRFIENEWPKRDQEFRKAIADEFYELYRDDWADDTYEPTVSKEEFMRLTTPSFIWATDLGLNISYDDGDGRLFGWHSLDFEIGYEKDSKPMYFSLNG